MDSDEGERGEVEELSGWTKGDLITDFWLNSLILAIENVASNGRIVQFSVCNCLLICSKASLWKFLTYSLDFLNICIKEQGSGLH